MRHPKIIISGIAVAAVAAAAGGITAASAGTSPASSTHSASQSSAATVRTAPATVGGKTETILVNGRGLPLYYYRPDTATRSLVSGGLLALWPAVTSATSAAGAGLSGKLTILMDSHGDQVTYNGHPLYTFADDQTGQVTGQGVSDFFVATPGLAPITGSPAPAGPAPAAPSGGSYGY
jgi:predicted lipoprotein with Yx(FWY)xxD motif